MDLELYMPAGILIITFSLACLILNAIVLSIIAKYAEFHRYPAYKFMLLMGVFDVSQGLAHFTTGFFSIFEWNAYHWVYRVLSVMVSPAYQSYVFLTVIIAFHRLIVSCTSQEKLIFSSTGTWFWCMLVALVFSAHTAIQLSGKVYTFYDVWNFRWDYDYSLPWTAPRFEYIFYYEVCGILIAWIFHILIALSLFRKRNDQAAAVYSVANRMILIHSFVITVYCTVQNILWFKLDFITGPNKIQNFILNVMWIGNSGLSSFLCILLNRRVQKAILATMKKNFVKTGWI